MDWIYSRRISDSLFSSTRSLFPHLCFYYAHVPGLVQGICLHCSCDHGFDSGWDGGEAIKIVWSLLTMAVEGVSSLESDQGEKDELWPLVWREREKREKRLQSHH